MYTIYPIKCGVINETIIGGGPITKGGLTYLHDASLPVPIPVISFLITADDPNSDTVVLVDTGVSTQFESGGPKPIRRGLTERDLEPDDVDYVVLTHLHYDHTSNNNLFPNAEFIVQRVEIEAAHDPLPVMESAYVDEYIAELDELNTTIIDGDDELVSGINLLLTPGHTAGMQSVVVETSDSPHGIISDLAYCKQNLDPSASSMLNGHGEVIEITPSELDYIAPGLHVSVTDCYESIDRLRDRIGDGLMLGGHVTEILDRSYPTE